MSKDLGFKFCNGRPKYNVVFDDGGILEIIEDTSFIPSRERDLLQALKATVQEPPPDLFKNLIFYGYLMLQVDMDSTILLTLQSSHGIILLIS
jgi:hypothetical protein